MKPRVILLEDDELIRDSLTRFLSRKGYDVIHSPDPSICPVLQRYRNGEIQDEIYGDYLLTDNNMPVLSGLELIELQMKIGCKSAIANRAVMSATWEESDIAKAKRLGCEVFHKPLDLKEVLSWLERGKESLCRDRKLVSLSTE
jgi:CheY-like chemotaxis protein